MPRGVSRYDEAVLQRRLWTPALEPPALWLDLQDLPTLTVAANAVTGIRNKGAFAGDGFIDAGRQAPDFFQNFPLLNGFNGFGRTTTAGWYGINVNTVALHTFYIVAQYLNSTESVFGAGFQFLFGASTGAAVSVSINTANWSNSLGTGSGTFRNGSLISSLVGMPMPLTVWEFSAPAPINAAWMFGNRQTAGTRTFQGRFAEIIAYSSAPSLALRLRVTGYLGWKFGVPLVADHPFVNQPPLIGG